MVRSRKHLKLVQIAGKLSSSDANNLASQNLSPAEAALIRVQATKFERVFSDYKIRQKIFDHFNLNDIALAVASLSEFEQKRTLRNLDSALKNQLLRTLEELRGHSKKEMNEARIRIEAFAKHHSDDIADKKSA